MRKLLLMLAAGLSFVSSAAALDGLESLQQAALSDQATECMIHEYTRRYNEVLRDFSRQRKPWSTSLDDTAHGQAMRWVRSVWRFADQRVVGRNLESMEFRSAIERFRRSQKTAYPDLSIVN